MYVYGMPIAIYNCLYIICNYIYIHINMSLHVSMSVYALGCIIVAMAVKGNAFVMLYIPPRSAVHNVHDA